MRWVSWMVAEGEKADVFSDCASKKTECVGVFNIFSQKIQTTLFSAMVLPQYGHFIIVPRKSEI